MKLIIQIPCHNEEHTLPQTFADLPTRIDGIDVIETQIVDDGSTDNTVEVAKKLGVTHIISFKNNKGLAAAFKAGAQHALEHGADILVNTDGDNQYFGGDISRLVKPIVDGQADIVIGCRPIKDHPEFSFIKKILQRLGSMVLRNISKTNVRDAASGFRAYSKTSLMHLNIYSSFSYCMETLIQAGLSNMKVDNIDIQVNPKTRDSRLFKSIFEYISRSGSTMVGIFLVYRAKKLFLLLSGITLLFSLILLGRYVILISFMGANGSGFWPSVILSGVLLAISFQLLFTGILASLVSSNRMLLEEIKYRLAKMEDRQNRSDDSSR
jgi:glycosyltransferase involved in cell wall biosynthesis